MSSAQINKKVDEALKGNFFNDYPPLVGGGNTIRAVIGPGPTIGSVKEPPPPPTYILPVFQALIMSVSCYVDLLLL